MLTDKRKEKLSAFLDNDLHRDELMSFSLSAEDEDAVQLQRYQIVGDTLRGEVSDASFIDISQAVREALINENIAGQMPAAQHSATSNTAAQPEPVASGWGLSALLRPAAGMAVAASVALVMVVSISQQETGAIAPVTGPVASNAQQPLTQPVVQDEMQLAVQVPANNKTTASGVTVSYPAAENDPKLNQRLVNQHLEFATQDTMQGRLPYVRAVSFEPEK